MSIIAILAAMLMGVIGKARESSRRVGCLSNLRQLSGAFTAFAGENDMCLPYGYWVGSLPGQGKKTWDSFINPYINAQKGVYTKIYTCPGDGPALPLPAMRRSYSMVRGYVNGGLSGVGSVGNNQPDEPLGIRLSAILAPSDTLLLVERSAVMAKDGTDNSAGGTACSVTDTATQQTVNGTGVKLHQGHFSYLYIDGHVANVDPKVTVGTAGTMDAPRGPWTIDPTD